MLYILNIKRTDVYKCTIFNLFIKVKHVYMHESALVGN